uniref:Isoform 2 of Prenylated Rab acceptor 1 n=1 Tax=Saccharomyces cerevisiae (strain ATCC 204508 / S288c) TaxID=559292 RepID=P53633-2
MNQLGALAVSSKL